jgi:hypothetical protein
VATICLRLGGCCRRDLRLPERVSLVPKPGVIGVFVALPEGTKGFVDARNLPRTAG